MVAQLLALLNQVGLALELDLILVKLSVEMEFELVQKPVMMVTDRISKDVNKIALQAFLDGHVQEQLQMSVLKLVEI